MAKTHPIRVRSAVRRRQIIDMRIKGMPMTAIAAELGISKQSVHYHLTAAMLDLRTEGLEDLVKLELERLDHLQNAVWPKAMAGDPSAVGRALEIQARRAKLLGLDSPVQHQIGGRDGPPIPVVILNQR